MTLFFSCLFVVFLEEADSHGQTHDQRSRNGVSAAGKPVLYPLGALCVLNFYCFFHFSFLDSESHMDTENRKTRSES